jgi:aminoglycoside phosphotransferase family enzyme/predicted kinase
MPCHEASPTAPANEALVKALAGRLGGELIETHISWVILAGDAAWKIKKALRLSFVDYTALDSRRHYCEEEVRLNRRLAAPLYLGVTPITGTPDAPEPDGPGVALEWAVHMRRFAPGSLFSEQLDAGTLKPGNVDELASLLADFHKRAPAAPPMGGYGSPARRIESALAALEGAAGHASEREQAQLAGWIRHMAGTLSPLWEQRCASGRIRECHGDLHLANLVSLPGGVAAFDGIEFDPALRWIDMLDDIAFTVMDFCARGRQDLAFRLLNGWLDHTGDHEALPALRFAVVYRALVRAQAAALCSSAPGTRRYLDVAMAWMRPSASPSLTITCGLPGSGKSHESLGLLERMGAIRVRSDVERKRLAGLDMLDDSARHGLDLYTPEATRQTYLRLFAVARMAMETGLPAVIDAAFLRRSERDEARRLAREMGVSFGILVCEAPRAVLRQRLLERRGDPSEANANVLECLSAAVEPLTPEEASYAIPILPA